MGTSADDDAMALAETADVEAFLDSIANGVPELLAGIEVGWTPMQTRRRLKKLFFSFYPTQCFRRHPKILSHFMI